jgi:uncharacterized protein (TIRG00374 family)
VVSHRKSALRFAARVALSVAALTAIFVAAQMENVLAALSRAHGELILLGLMLNLLTRLFAAERTYVISRGVGLPLSRARTIDAMFVSNFWSLVLPGVSAGSVATVYRYARYGASVADSVGVLGASRAVELAIFCLTGAIAFAWSPQASGWRVLVTLCAIPLVVFGAFALAHWYRRRSPMSRGSWAGSGLARKFRETAARAVHAFSGAPRSHVAAAGGLAFVQCVLDAASALAFAWSLGLQITLLDALWINVLTYLAILLPISIAGLGVREAAVILALGPLGIGTESAIALAVLMFAATLLNAVIGGVLQLVVKPRASAQLAPSSVRSET